MGRAGCIHTQRRRGMTDEAAGLFTAKFARFHPPLQPEQPRYLIAAMKSLLASLVLVFALPCFAEDAPPNTLTDAEKSAGWRLLFDGKDAAKWWHGYKKDKLPAEWVVEDGALVRKGGGNIVTNDEFESFELSIDWKISEGGNSGVMFNMERV
jgi:hypothetical protein